MVSAATIWEIAIKRGLGKLRAPANVVGTVSEAGLRFLSITAAHAETVADLPELHRDPFDRILVAQAIHEGLTIVTADAAISSYAVAAIDPVN